MQSIRLDAVGKNFGQQSALSSIDLGFGSGERTALLGPSGAGKTTILRIIAGLDQPSTGKVYFGQRDVTTQPPVERKVAMVFQDYAVYPQLSVVENLKASLKRSQLPSSESANRIAETLEWFRLTQYAQRRPAQLSGGQLQRVALAKAVVQRPEVMLLDEPFSQLDTQLREQLRELLLELHQRFPSTMLLVTHDPMDAMRIASKVAMLDAGRIIATGTGDEVYRHPVSRTAANLISPLGVNWMKLKLFDCAATGDSICTSKNLLVGKPDSQIPFSPLAWQLSQTHVENVLSKLESTSKGKSVWLGFRPESVRLTSRDSPESKSNGLTFQGEVRSVQSLGFAKLATIANDRFQIKMLVNSIAATHCETAVCHVNEDELLWFADSTAEQ